MGAAAVIEEADLADGGVGEADESDLFLKSDEEAELRVEHRRRERHWALVHAATRSSPVVVVRRT
jgi:hypothetical protein